MTQHQVDGKLSIGGIIFGARGLNASRYFANVEGLTGKSTKKSYFCNAETIGPLDSSSATAMGPPKR